MKRGFEPLNKGFKLFLNRIWNVLQTDKSKLLKLVLFGCLFAKIMAASNFSAEFYKCQVIVTKWKNFGLPSICFFR